MLERVQSEMRRFFFYPSCEFIPSTEELANHILDDIIITRNTR